MPLLVLARTSNPINSTILTEGSRAAWATLISVPPRPLLPAHVAVARSQLNRGNIRYGDRFYLLIVIANLTANANLRLAYAYLRLSISYMFIASLI